MSTEMVCYIRTRHPRTRSWSRVVLDLLRSGCELERITKNQIAIMRTPGDQIVRIPFKRTKTKHDISTADERILKAEGLL